VAPRRGRAVAVDGLGRRRRGERHAGVVKIAEVAARSLGLERLSRKVGPEIGQADEFEEPADDLDASLLKRLKHFEEAKSLMLKMMPVAQRILGENHITTLRMRLVYAQSLQQDDRATLDDLREAVTTLEDTERIARRVLGGAHPTATGIEYELRDARAALAARETPSASK